MCFYYQYIKCLPGLTGCYGQYGTLIHSCLEKYARGELAEYELSNEYRYNFDKIITEPFPDNAYVDLREKYYNQGLDYFNNFEGFRDRKVLGVEEEYFFKIGDYNFTGKIDLEFQTEMVDHKTKKEQHLLRLTKKHNKEDYIQMVDGRYIHFDNFKQLFIYSIPYKEKYGIYPEFLSLNMIRFGDWYTIRFSKEYFERARQWVMEEIDKIYKTNDFNKGEDVDNYWCGVVCSQRLNCPYSDRYLGIEVSL